MIVNRPSEARRAAIQPDAMRWMLAGFGTLLLMPWDFMMTDFWGGVPYLLWIFLTVPPRTIHWWRSAYWVTLVLLVMTVMKGYVVWNAGVDRAMAAATISYMAGGRIMTVLVAWWFAWQFHKHAGRAEEHQPSKAPEGVRGAMAKPQSVDTWQSPALRRLQRKELETLAARGVMHDVNNHLFVIQAQSEEIGEAHEAEDDPLRESVAMLEEAVTRASEMTHLLPVLTRAPETGDGPVEVKGTLAEAEPLFRLLLSRSVNLEVKTEEGLEAWVDLGKGEALQLMLNMAMLAREALPVGGNVRLEMNVIVGDEGGRVSLLLQADGRKAEGGRHLPLESPNEQPRIEAALGVCRVLTESVGGTFEIRVAPESGPTFRVGLPLVAAPAAMPENTKIIYTAKGGYRRGLIVQALGDMGATVVAVDGLEQAREVIDGDSGGAQVLIVDDEVLQSDGMTTLADISSIMQNGCIILLREEGSAVEFEGKAPGIEVLEKPVAIRELVGQIKTSLQQTIR